MMLLMYLMFCFRYCTPYSIYGDTTNTECDYWYMRIGEIPDTIIDSYYIDVLEDVDEYE